ncbi:MAG: hypothetical protein CMQ19_13420 [Gammaproteobacteria bacterium]|nr:hypothetical protein [Gammaproteobacteria bacterium]
MAISLNPDADKAHNNRGASLQSAGSYGQAVESHERTISLNPDNPEAYNNLGMALEKLDEP